MKIYLDGKYKNVTSKEFEAMLPGSLDGKGAFETMRMYDGVIFAFDEHMQRLHRGLAHYKMTSPVSKKSIQRILGALIKKTKLRNARVRVIIWKDPARHISISLQALNLPSADVYKAGYKVCCSKHTRNRSKSSHIKTIDYELLKQIYKKAHKRGFDEALLTNSKGHIVEGTRTNVFFIKNKTLCTPAISCGCLNGITRQMVIKCARAEGIKVKMVRATLKQILQSDGMFVTGSTLEIMPVQSIDRTRISKKRSEIIERIKNSYSRLVKAELDKSK